MNLDNPFVSATLVIAAVRVVLPWSTWPIVPTFTCGFVRSNLALAMISSLRFECIEENRGGTPCRKLVGGNTYSLHAVPPRPSSTLFLYASLVLKLATGIEPVT